MILAGTNNVGDAARRMTRRSRTSRGACRRIVATCRQKAPTATIVLTAIFPRNDNMAVMPEIDRINANLARLADGKASAI